MGVVWKDTNDVGTIKWNYCFVVLYILWWCWQLVMCHWKEKGEWWCALCIAFLQAMVKALKYAENYSVLLYITISLCVNYHEQLVDLPILFNVYIIPLLTHSITGPSFLWYTGPLERKSTFLIFNKMSIYLNLL